MQPFIRTAVPFLAFCILALPSVLADEPIYQRGFLSVEDAQQSIELPPGYSLELLLAEPEIDELSSRPSTACSTPVGRPSKISAAFASLETRHIEIKQTGQVGNKDWSIHGLDIYGKLVR